MIEIKLDICYTNHNAETPYRRQPSIYLFPCCFDDSSDSANHSIRHTATKYGDCWTDY